jgi:hypothetical protein
MLVQFSLLGKVINMDERIRSADLLVKIALADPNTLEQLKLAPEKTLQQLASKATTELPPVIPPPDTKTANIVWIIVVASFVLVIMGAAYVIGTSVFTKIEKDVVCIGKVDMILTVFTTVVAFIPGLLSPSPVTKSK